MSRYCNWHNNSFDVFISLRSKSKSVDIFASTLDKNKYEEAPFPNPIPSEYWYWIRNPVWNRGWNIFKHNKKAHVYVSLLAISQNVDVEWKLLIPHCRQIQIHHFKDNFSYLIIFFTDNKQQVSISTCKSLHRTGDQPLRNSIVTQCFEVNIHHQGPFD